MGTGVGLGKGLTFRRCTLLSHIPIHCSLRCSCQAGSRCAPAVAASICIIIPSNSLVIPAQIGCTLQLMSNTFSKPYRMCSAILHSFELGIHLTKFLSDLKPPSITPSCRRSHDNDATHPRLLLLPRNLFHRRNSLAIQRPGTEDSATLQDNEERFRQGQEGGNLPIPGPKSVETSTLTLRSFCTFPITSTALLSVRCAS